MMEQQLLRMNNSLPYGDYLCVDKSIMMRIETMDYVDELI